MTGAESLSLGLNPTRKSGPHSYSEAGTVAELGFLWKAIDFRPRRDPGNGDLSQLVAGTKSAVWT